MLDAVCRTLCTEVRGVEATDLVELAEKVSRSIDRSMHDNPSVEARACGTGMQYVGVAVLGHDRRRTV